MTFSSQKTWKKFLKDLLGGIIKEMMEFEMDLTTQSLGQSLR